MSNITEIKARQVLDSRGNPTIEVDDSEVRVLIDIALKYLQKTGFPAAPIAEKANCDREHLGICNDRTKKSGVY